MVHHDAPGAPGGHRADSLNDMLFDHLTLDARTTIFQHFWEQSEACTTGIDLDALRGCVRILPSSGQDVLYAKVQVAILNRMPQESHNADRLYIIADICMANMRLGSSIFCHIHDYLKRISLIIRDIKNNHVLEEDLRNVIAYLNFIKSSYWWGPDRPQYITHDVIQVLVDLVGHHILDAHVQDTLSALISLTKSPVAILRDPELTYSSCSTSSSKEGTAAVREALIGQQLWTRLRDLPLTYFGQESSKCFRTWFQWCHHATIWNTDLDAIYDPLYWSILRVGFLSGYSEQRKYCLGILRLSIDIACRDIETPLMVVRIDQRSRYRAQYGKYVSLYQTIVLDRYVNQVQACLPDLTNLLGTSSVINPGWTMVLLSSALNPKVQDGVRKVVGNWYMDFIANAGGPVIEHEQFIVEGLLPWATQGSLFTSSLTSYRGRATCSTHGDILADVISRSVGGMPTQVSRRNLFAGVLQFVLDRNGRLFQYSIVYLLKGLMLALKGLPTSCADMDRHGMELLGQVSRLPGLPEIASDLCFAYCGILMHQILEANPSLTVPGFEEMTSRLYSLQVQNTHALSSPIREADLSLPDLQNITTVQQFLESLRNSAHRLIQGSSFAHACDILINILASGCPNRPELKNIVEILEALWDEAERQEFRRPVAVAIPALFFHRELIQLCEDTTNEATDEALTPLLIKVMNRIRELSEGRTYLLSVLVGSVRNASLIEHQTISRFPFEDFLFQFINSPPLPKKEFLFEIAAGEMLQSLYANRSYEFYYGKREWHAYAGVIDLLNRFPESQIETAKRTLRRLIEPWRIQKYPVPVISRWKNAFQLQCMLVLTESCISESDASWYLESFMAALVLEAWPRYRYLLEWIISRIYYRFPFLVNRILSDLIKLDETVPIHTASLMKLAVLAALFLHSEEYTLQLVTQLVSFSANPKIQIRHEAQWNFPIIWELAESKNWTSITSNPAFSALNDYIRKLDKFSNPPPTIRTLKLDAVRDYTLVNIFQGKYLALETPDHQYATYEDFKDIWEDDLRAEYNVPPARIPLGVPDHLSANSIAVSNNHEAMVGSAPDFTPAPLQTKTGFDLNILLPNGGPPSAVQRRPASVVLIASLIDNPMNLGGLSRISESFGLEALYINDLKHTSTKDFQSTAVTSHKHLPIRELRVSAVPDFLLDMRKQGYEIVAIEQTDRSGILGEDIPLADNVTIQKEEHTNKSSGTLPRKCVLVLGSEKGGVSAEVLAVVNRCVEIRTVGVTRSLNVQTAGGIAVYEWWREWGGKA
ncbi:hypothetical protein B0J11DRAFT_515534 [Dendryphion nanum]|uniref:tRNA/rRNA methyltransferase SpoU type domain-containing protein n=1 Tax=Dendryphion nanum TaxID=256645 RepID=A0A9P9IYV2_9PLEO|nr:hypothetical protein B0J11DRAFT_515534 [Dendryphion nanum]